MTTDLPPSSPRRSSPSRRPMSRPVSLTIPNPDVFSDDYAIDGSPDVSPIDSIQRSSENLNMPTSQPHTSLSSPPRPLQAPRPSSTSKRPLHDVSATVPNRAISTISHAESSAQRTSSTSSRFSMPRAQSPYVGSTAPSHPYAMYPQVTRASSIASESTIRPLERPFVLGGGPAHPYGLYPQNTVSEETNAIPVGFPGMSQNYQTRSTDADIADIVGLDGHVEELPPYSRYAENVVPKVQTQPITSTVSQQPLSPISQISDSAVQSNVDATGEAGEFDEKKGWRSKARRRVCGGLPLWAVLLILLVVVLAATVGAVIGGVVGVDRGTDIAASAVAEASGQPAVVTTTTVFLDATPLPTTTVMPETWPVGEFSVGLGGPHRLESNTCVNSSFLAPAWSCLKSGGIDIRVDYAGDDAPGPLKVSLCDNPQLQPNFTYGAQPPVVPGEFILQPYGEKDDGDPALFFWTYYNKITIWPLDEFPLPQRRQRRSNNDEDVVATASIGDHVWVCTWTDSILEFLLYPSGQDPFADNLSSTCTTASTSTPTSTPTVSGRQHGTDTSSAAHSGGTGAPKKRQSPVEEAEQPPQYPLDIRILEKRKEAPNPPTYCELMLVQTDWSLSPIPNIQKIPVPEDDYTSGGPGSDIVFRRWTSSEVRSYCACEYDNY